MKKLISLLLILIVTPGFLFAQKKIINIPDIPGYITLKCDFHTHTVFSDGNVWPTYRIDEAWKDGLDVLAITDHIEYQPHQEYIPADHNAAYKIASDLATERNLILVPGTEITRGMPPGHLNALFVKDAAAIYRDDPFETVENAVKQGAFIHWNHPGWKSQEPDGIPKLYDIHLDLLDKGYIHGIEFFNSTEYYPNILEWCDEYGLAVIANSDVHGIISEDYGHNTRPMTLVFTKERSLESLKEALFDARTLAYFNHTLAGDKALLKEVFDASISISDPYFEDERYRWLEITNNSDVPFQMINGTDGVADAFTIDANSITILRVAKDAGKSFEWDVRNMLTGYNEHLHIVIDL